MPKRTLQVENFTSPGRLYTVDADKFEAMRAAYLSVLTTEPPGMTPAQIQAASKEHLPESLFPGGAKAGWWAKSVQLDLEAKGVIVRAPGSPVRLRKV
jgi:hypothetical protein